MRFVIVTQTFPPRIGGMQDVMESLAIKLSNDYQTIVLPDHHIPSNHPILKTKINFIFSNFPKLIRSFIKKLKLKKILLPEDIIICDSWKSINTVPKKVKKLIVFAHGQEFLSSSKKFKLIQKSLNKANYIICNSQYTHDLIEKLNITNTNKIIIPPTYSLVEPKQKNKNFKIKSKTISILTISRLEERKGIIPTLKSLAELNKKKLIKPFLWNICGEGKQMDELKKYVKKLDLSDHVKLVGKISGDTKERFFENSDLFVMPSYRVKSSIEGFGISYVEAAAYGIPSIAGIEGGVGDAVIHSQTGWCVNPLNPKQLSQTLIEAINNGTKRKKYGLQARKKFLDIFLGEKVFRKFMETIISWR